MTIYLSPSELTAALALRDLSDPAAGPHAIQQLLAAVLNRLGHVWPIPHDVRRTSPLVAVADNYDRLGYSPAADDSGRALLALRQRAVMLRSHTSAGVPRRLRSLSGAGDDPTGPAGAARAWSTGVM